MYWKIKGLCYESFCHLGGRGCRSGSTCLLIDMGRSGGCGVRHGRRGHWSSIHTNSCRKTYQSRNDFFIFVVPEL